MSDQQNPSTRRYVTLTPKDLRTPNHEMKLRRGQQVIFEDAVWVIIDFTPQAYPVLRTVRVQS